MCKKLANVTLTDSNDWVRTFSSRTLFSLLDDFYYYYLLNSSRRQNPKNRQESTPFPTTPFLVAWSSQSIPIPNAIWAVNIRNPPRTFKSMRSALRPPTIGHCSTGNFRPTTMAPPRPRRRSYRCFRASRWSRVSCGRVSPHWIEQQKYNLLFILRIQNTYRFLCHTF